jgi:hypothetical protein
LGARCLAFVVAVVAPLQDEIADDSYDEKDDADGDRGGAGASGGEMD